MAVARYKLMDLRWGTASVSVPAISANSMTSVEVDVADLKKGDYVLVMVEEAGSASITPIGAYIVDDGSFVIDFANLDGAGSGPKTYEVIWQRMTR